MTPLPAISRIASLEELTREVPSQDFAQAARTDDVVCTLFPGETVPLRNYSRLDAPPFPTGSARAFFAALEYEARPLRLYSLRDVRFFGSSSLFAAGDAVVRDSAWHWKARQVDSLPGLFAELAAKIGREPPAFDAPARRIAGAHLLAGSHHFKNYWHWHLDVLPSITLAARLPGLAGSKILIDRNIAYVDGSLGALGAPARDLVVLPKREVVAVDLVIFASPLIPQGTRVHPLAAECFPLIKSAVLRDAPARSGRRVFASRGQRDRRSLTNRAEIEARLAERGFEIVDPGALPYAEQIALFDSAEVVVGEHGANLGNIGFCRPGTLVVELFHPIRHVLCYVSLAEVMGLSHRSLIGEALDAERWSLDPDATVAAVDDAIQRHAQYRRAVAAAGGGFGERVSLGRAAPDR